MNGGMQQLDGLVRTTRGAASPSSLLTSIVAYWPLSEASGSRADSAGANTLTDNNTVTQAAGPNGSDFAAQFTRANGEYLSIADNAALSMGDIDFAIALLVYFDSVAAAASGSGRTLLGKYNFSSNREYAIFQEDNSGNPLEFVVSANGTTEVKVGVSPPATGGWHAVIAEHDATNNTISIQLDNGTPATTSHSSGVLNGTAAFQLGRLADYADYDFGGRLARVGIWKRLLTSDEKTYLVEEANAPYPFDPVTLHFQTLIFEDLFSGSSIDSAKWLDTSGFGNPGGAANPSELQAYISGAVTVTGGNLVLTVSDVSGAPVSGKDYTSGLVRSKTKFDTTYGRIEVRAKLTAGQGFWPAIWMLPTDDTGGTYYLPEIDIMEAYSTMDTMHMTYHYDNGGLTSSGSTYSTDLADGSFHTFRVDWSPTVIRWYLDGSIRKSFETSAFISDVPMYILINLAVGGGAGDPDETTPFPSTMLIDYVKVWSY